MGPIIALLGAESTGKTQLAKALAERLQSLGQPAVVVAEYLREFCDSHGRTPRPDEQAGIAAEQARRIEAAALGGATVLADTTPLMIAVYSDYVFGDRSLYADAIAWQRRCTATLLTGLDLTWQPDGLQREGPQVQAPVDALVRAALFGACQPFGVIYGQGQARCEAALAAVRNALALPPPDGATVAASADSAEAARTVDADNSRPGITAPGPAGDEAERTRWRMCCRECLVPGCEHLRGWLPGAGAGAAASGGSTT